MYFHWLLAEAELAALLKITRGQDFEARCDHAIIRILVDTILRRRGKEAEVQNCHPTASGAPSRTPGGTWACAPGRQSWPAGLAELADHAPEALSDADSIGRPGRAVAVTLIAVTQRPMRKAMGQSALRSQMEVRICSASASATTPT